MGEFLPPFVNSFTNPSIHLPIRSTNHIKNLFKQHLPVVVVVVAAAAAAAAVTIDDVMPDINLSSSVCCRVSVSASTVFRSSSAYLCTVKTRLCSSQRISLQCSEKDVCVRSVVTPCIYKAA